VAVHRESLLILSALHAGSMNSLEGPF